MQFAITREVSPAIARCELTHLARAPIELTRAREQHAAYVALLRDRGRTVIELPADPEAPDSVFVEDAAVVVDELAVITRPGAASRRRELAPIAHVLGRFRATLARIEAPGTLDGGDVLRFGREVLVGRTPRTNDAGVAQLRAALAPHGYTVRAVEVRGCLHLKTAVTAVGPRALLINPAWIDRRALGVSPEVELLEVDPSEPFAANTLRLDELVVVPRAFEKTRARLVARGLRCADLPADELAKAEGGLTCCSLLFTA